MKNKPFKISNVREITDALDRNEITYSRMVEMLNEIAEDHYRPRPYSLDPQADNYKYKVPEIDQRIVYYIPVSSLLDTTIWDKVKNLRHVEFKFGTKWLWLPLPTESDFITTTRYGNNPTPGASGEKEI